jgi:hypothetical protein
MKETQKTHLDIARNKNQALVEWGGEKEGILQ